MINDSAKEIAADPGGDRRRQRHDRGDAGPGSGSGLQPLRPQEQVLQSLRAEGQEGRQPVRGEGQSLRGEEVTYSILRTYFDRLCTRIGRSTALAREMTPASAVRLLDDRSDPD